VAHYPMVFPAFSEATFGIKTPWHTQSGPFRSQVAVPKEFEGDSLGLSPEDLFGQALVNCFIGTFKVYAEKSKLQFETVFASIDLFVDLDDSTKQPVMKSAVLNAKISGASSAEKAKNLAEKAFRAGFILNSVKTSIQLNIETI
jgi:organic hydroperoxide reductase OsmC/OhrA